MKKLKWFEWVEVVSGAAFYILMIALVVRSAYTSYQDGDYLPALVLSVLLIFLTVKSIRKLISVVKAFIREEVTP